MPPLNGTSPIRVDPRRLALGTAQLGMDYGIANRAGRPAELMARSIVQSAVDKGVRYLDTAPAYGVAETLVGTIAECRAFRIVTKTIDIRQIANPTEVTNAILDGFARSRDRIGQRVYALLVHQAGSVTHTTAPYVLQALRSLKESGQVERIGVSVYDPDELERVLEFFEPEIVQAPVNILDQRMVRSPVLKQLTKNGMEFHARSAFLQGVLLAGSEELPPFLADLKPFLDQIQTAAADADVSRLEATLGFVLSQDSVSTVVVGVENVAQLEAIVAATNCRRDLVDFSNVGDLPPALIDPRAWNRG